MDFSSVAFLQWGYPRMAGNLWSLVGVTRLDRVLPGFTEFFFLAEQKCCHVES